MNENNLKLDTDVVPCYTERVEKFIGRAGLTE